MRKVRRVRRNKRVTRRPLKEPLGVNRMYNHPGYRPSAPHIPRENHPFPAVSVIIPAMNEEGRIAAVIAEARAVHPETEVIVVANGCEDQTAIIAERMGAHVLTYTEPLGHDVGRSVGAGSAKGSVLLFTDSDMVIPANELRPYVQAVQRGVDVALNDHTGPIERTEVHRVILAKYTLNSMLGRPDLHGASMTAVPHALSRQALEVIGVEALQVPPKAHVLAIDRGLRVEAVHRVEVGRMNLRAAMAAIHWNGS